MNLDATKYIGILKNIGANLLLVVGSQLILKGVDWIWENVFTFTEKHKQKVQGLAEEAMKTFNDALDSNNNKQSSVLSMTDEFNKLAAGVSRTGENLSLTNEQYSTYKSYVEKLIEINPALVEGINSQGDAFINNKTAIEETTKALKEQQRAIYAGFFNGKDDADVLENLVDQYKDTAGKILGDLGFKPSITKQIKENLDINSIGGLSNLYNNTANKSDKEKLRELLGITDDEGYWLKTQHDPIGFAKIIEQNRQEISNIGANYDYSKWLEKQLDKNRDLLIQLDQQNEQLEKIKDDFDQYVDKYARSRQEYYNLTDQQARLVDTFVESYGFSDKMFESGADQDVVERQMRSDVDKFIKFLDGLSDETTAKMTELATLDKSKLSYNDWRIQVNKLIKEIMSDPNYNEEFLSADQLKVQFGVAIETNDGQIEDEYLNAVDRIVNRLKTERANYNKDFGILDGSIISKLHDLTPDQINILDNTEDLSQFNSWQAILDYLNGAQKFDIKTYQDTIDAIIKDLNKLGEANEKLKKNELDPSVDGATEYVMDLIKEFPTLNEYVDFGAKNFGRLGEGIERVIEERPEALLKSWDDLGALTNDAAREVNNYRAAIKQLQKDAKGGTISWLVQMGLTEQDYLNYVLKDYDKIIDKLNDEKDNLSDVNDELNEQKEQLDEIIDKYQTAGNTVVKALDEKINDITEYYDAQIDKIKTENEELERSIELQQKQAALANAKKRKIRVYTETEGWVWKDDNAAIASASKDLKDTETNIRVAELEKQRDEEIKLWEDYKDAWEDAMEAYTKAHDEAITEGILGSDWRDNVMARDENMLNNYEVTYSSFQYRLNDDIEEQIRANTEYEKSIDKKIQKYEDDKEAIQDWVDEQKTSADEYFGVLDDIKITENSSWAERLANFEEFKNNYLAIKAQIESEDVSKMYAVKYNGELKGLFNSEAEARRAGNNLLNSYINAETARDPSLRNSSNIAHLRKQMEEMLQILAPGSFSNGGVIDYTGLANVHGSSSNSEVVLSSSQGKSVYDFIQSGMLNKATEAMSAAYNSLIDLLPKPKVGNLINPMLNVPNGVNDVVNPSSNENTNIINVSFAGANINAESYESFKGFMDKYTNDLFMQLQTGKK